jgi:cytochrome c-type biogenesis protein CcmE
MADTVLAKHDETYMVETLKKQGHWQESAAPNAVRAGAK